MESLKDLIEARTLLEFEIAQTKKSKELKAIKEKIDAIVKPAKIRALKKADRIGYVKGKNEGSLISEGKLPIDGKTAKYKVTLSQISAHQRTTVNINPF